VIQKAGILQGDTAGVTLAWANWFVWFTTSGVVTG
jgi:hypothetical protein